MRRATLLVGVALALALGGCLAGPGGVGSPSPATGSDTPTDSPDAGTPTPEGTTPIPTATTPTPACTESSVTTVDPVRETVTPSPLPDRPATLNATTAASLATAYERAYRRNRGLEADTTQYEVYTFEPSVRAVEGGYVVTMTAGYWYNAADPQSATATGTPTVVHADGPEYRVAYFVGTDRLRRDSALEDGELAPRQGAMVECWSAA